MNFTKKLLFKKEVILLVVLAIIFLFAQSTPSTAIRTQVFIMGYPKVALTTEIIDDEYHNTVNHEQFAIKNAKAYTLTKPPIEKATQGELRNYLVRKIGILYFAEYYGEV